MYCEWHSLKHALVNAALQLPLPLGWSSTDLDVPRHQQHWHTCSTAVASIDKQAGTPSHRCLQCLLSACLLPSACCRNPQLPFKQLPFKQSVQASFKRDVLLTTPSASRLRLRLPWMALAS